MSFGTPTNEVSAAATARADRTPTSADVTIPAARWISLLPVRVEAAGEIAFENGVVVRRFEHESYDALDMPACQHHLFAYRLAGTVRAERKLGTVWQRAITRRGSITIVPAFQGSSWRLRGSGEILHFYLPPVLLGRVAEEDLEISPTTSVIEHLGVFDPRLGALVETFAWEVERGVTGFALYAEAVTTQIAVCLLRHHWKTRTASQRPACLRRCVEKRVAEYIDANLQNEISLSELAALADLGLAQFSKLFRESFGVSPYQHVLRRRIEWAKVLLQGREFSVAQVAVMVGFAHQAHFTTTFKRLCGNTPAAYRAEMQS